MARRSLVVGIVLCLLANCFCYPHIHLRKRATENDEQTTQNNEQNTNDGASTGEQTSPSAGKEEISNEVLPPVPYDDDDDDFDDLEPMNTNSSGDTGSNVFSLLRIAGAILPSSSNAGILRNIIRRLIKLNRPLRRQFIDSNDIEIDFDVGLKPPPFQKQEGNNNSDNESDSGNESDESGDNAAEESLEKESGDNSKDDSRSNDASVGDDSDYDSDEPPGGGDGQGGGILGLLAGLSGSEDGQSDLGSLLATVSGIVANLSGDGIDLNALIASGIGLFVGLLSEGEENPGAVIASYLLTSLDTITGGGSKNNGAFFGTFLSKLVKGTSAVGDTEESSEENGNKMKMSDSAGFFASLLMSLLGDMSKGSSGGSHPWRR